ncbi:gliding motility lipoprotein GldD [Spongiimicrobium salis]|uniref:gliding motility lipoprotein GldD n=1 Tax=Spongiimicrobium salis TaxID=1667022 RepID=UPI00374D7490
MKNRLFCGLLTVALLAMSCGETVLPKPEAMLRLEYPEAITKTLATQCDYTFAYNEIAWADKNEDCALTLEYPSMNATIFITYKAVEDNLGALVLDAEKLSSEHMKKADGFFEQPFVNADNKVYGMFYEVKGNTASQAQFYVTDSINHFLTGSLYFKARPNYDSILPAAIYLQKDIRTIMESLRWK